MEIDILMPGAASNSMRKKYDQSVDGIMVMRKANRLAYFTLYLMIV